MITPVENSLKDEKNQKKHDAIEFHDAAPPFHDSFRYLKKPIEKMEKETNRLPYAIERKNRDANAAFQGTVYKPCRILSSFLIALPLTNELRRGIIKTEDDTACGFQKLHRRLVS